MIQKNLSEAAPENSAENAVQTDAPAPRVSVVVPVYNVEKYLRECVESVLAQTFKNFECILVDDGSPDGSGAICDEFAARDERIHAFHQPNGGVSSARKLGVERSRGEWIMFLDSDDVLAPAALETLLRFADSETDLVEGNFENFRDGDPLPAFPTNAESAKLAYTVNAVDYAVGVCMVGVRGFNKTFFLGPVEKIIRHALLTNEILDVPAEIVYGEDTTILLRLSAHELRRAKKIDAMILAVRVRESSASFATISYSEDYLLKMYAEMIAAIKPFPNAERHRVRRAIAFHAKRHAIRVIRAFDGQNVSPKKWLPVLRPGADKFSLDPRSMFFFYAIFKFRIVNLLRSAILAYAALCELRNSKKKKTKK